MKKRSLLERLREKKVLGQDMAVGVGWYTPGDWERIKATATDPDGFESSFAEWEQMANDNFDRIRKRYPGAVKVNVLADDFLSWCLAEGKPNDAGVRSEFVSRLLYKGVPRSD